VIVATVGAAFAFEDENSAAEANRAIRHLRMIGEALGVLVLPIHHFGKNDKVGLRGSSAFRAGADAILTVVADSEHGGVARRELSLAKSRTEPEGPIGRFMLRYVRLGVDEDGEPFGSCSVVPVAGSASNVGEAKRLGRKPRAAPALVSVLMTSLGRLARTSESTAARRRAPSR
jgi:hypothetical protein